MERLTRWNEQTEQAELVGYDTEEWKEFKETLHDLDEHFVSTAMNQLAIYEDTGLEPHQIDAICHQLDALVEVVLEEKTAEEQVPLIRLGLKIDDVVTIIHDSDGQTEKYRIHGDVTRKAICIYEEKTRVEMG